MAWRPQFWAKTLGKLAYKDLVHVTLLGVAPVHQGKGVGKQLVQDLCRAADMEGRSIVLRTGTKSNVCFIWPGALVESFT